MSAPEIIYADAYGSWTEKESVHGEKYFRADLLRPSDETFDKEWDKKIIFEAGDKNKARHFFKAGYAAALASLRADSPDGVCPKCGLAIERWHTCPPQRDGG